MIPNLFTTLTLKLCLWAVDLGEGCGCWGWSDTSNAGARRRIGTRSGTEGQPDQANRMGLFAGQCDQWLLSYTLNCLLIFGCLWWLAVVVRAHWPALEYPIGIITTQCWPNTIRIVFGGCRKSRTTIAYC
jgi:hypothetical protein